MYRACKFPGVYRWIRKSLNNSYIYNVVIYASPIGYLNREFLTHKRNYRIGNRQVNSNLEIRWEQWKSLNIIITFKTSALSSGGDSISRFNLDIRIMNIKAPNGSGAIKRRTDEVWEIKWYWKYCLTYKKNNSNSQIK